MGTSGFRYRKRITHGRKIGIFQRDASLLAVNITSTGAPSVGGDKLSLQQSSEYLHQCTTSPQKNDKLIKATTIIAITSRCAFLDFFFPSLLALFVRFQIGCVVTRCTASKLDNENTVQWCKEWCRLMEEAIYTRHHFVVAHADYCHSLCITGCTLPKFAAREPFFVSDQTCCLPHEPMVLLRFSQMTIKIQEAKNRGQQSNLYTSKPQNPSTILISFLTIQRNLRIDGELRGLNADLI